ncbi:hypothetical protein LP419_00845 [Massilia sp. H-1]|nr:hypothetical protein LP419_00845 [Massilia sp. H-1]
MLVAQTLPQDEGILGADGDDQAKAEGQASEKHGGGSQVHGAILTARYDEDKLIYLIQH